MNTNHHQEPCVNVTSRKPLLSRRGAAAFLNVQPQTLAVWATTKRYNLPYIKVGSRAMYRLSDLEHFLASRTVGGQVAED